MSVYHTPARDSLVCRGRRGFCCRRGNCCCCPLEVFHCWKGGYTEFRGRRCLCRWDCSPKDIWLSLQVEGSFALLQPPKSIWKSEGNGLHRLVQNVTNTWACIPGAFVRPWEQCPCVPAVLPELYCQAALHSNGQGGWWDWSRDLFHVWWDLGM